MASTAGGTAGPAAALAGAERAGRKRPHPFRSPVPRGALPGDPASTGGTYLAVEQSPAMTAGGHERLRPGLNHLAFRAGGRRDVDALVAEAPGNGWSLLFPGRHPYAGGPEHYAGYLANSDGFEVGLVADEGH